MRETGRLLLVLVLAVLIGGYLVAEDRPIWDKDLWDVDQSDVPPTGSIEKPAEPDVFPAPNLLTLANDKFNTPVIAISPNPKVPKQVFYRMKQEGDSLLCIELFTRRAHAQRRSSQFEPPRTRNEFMICVTYKESPGDTALFHAWRSAPDSVWSIQAIKETGFIRLMVFERTDSKEEPTGPGRER